MKQRASFTLDVHLVWFSLMRFCFHCAILNLFGIESIVTTGSAAFDCDNECRIRLQKQKQKTSYNYIKIAILLWLVRLGITHMGDIILAWSVLKANID